MAKGPGTNGKMKSTIVDWKWEAPPAEANGVDGKVVGRFNKFMARDEKTGTYSRVVVFEPGFRTDAFKKPETKLQNHEYWEEIYVIEGTMYDYGMNKTFTKGYYGLRSPGVNHGPYGTDEGCILWECSWYDRDWYEKHPDMD